MVTVRIHSYVAVIIRPGFSLVNAILVPCSSCETQECYPLSSLAATEYRMKQFTEDVGEGSSRGGQI